MRSWLEQRSEDRPVTNWLHYQTSGEGALPRPLDLLTQRSPHAAECRWTVDRTSCISGLFLVTGNSHVTVKKTDTCEDRKAAIPEEADIVGAEETCSSVPMESGPLSVLKIAARRSRFETRKDLSRGRGVRLPLPQGHETSLRG